MICIQWGHTWVSGQYFTLSGEEIFCIRCIIAWPYKYILKQGEFIGSKAHNICIRGSELLCIFSQNPEKEEKRRNIVWEAASISARWRFWIVAFVRFLYLIVAFLLCCQYWAIAYKISLFFFCLEVAVCKNVT